MYASFCKLGCLGKTYVIVSRRNMRTPNSPVPTRVRWYYACDRHSGGNNTEESIGCSLRMERSFNFWLRSEEHTSELQSLTNLVCRLLLEKKKKKTNTQI